MTIKVIESKRTTEVLGPRHKLWKEITFKRIANTLFIRFIRDFSTDLQSSINTTNVQPQMTSTPMVTRPVTITEAAVPPLPSTETVRLQGTPMEGQMVAILESLAYHSRMITFLQEQLSNLTIEVFQLQQQPPVTTATTQENLPVTRVRKFSVLSVESESSSIDSVDIDHNQGEIIVQTTSLPKPKSKPKKLTVNPTQENQRQHMTEPKSKPSENKVISNTPNACTLIIGDSIIYGINAKGLKNYVHCNGISGANAETGHEKMSVYNLRNFTIVVNYVGGNDI